MAVAVETETIFKSKTPKMLFRKAPAFINSMGFTEYAWDISHDGKKFLMLKQAATGADSAAEAPQRIIVVTNWFEELKKRVSAGK